MRELKEILDSEAYVKAKIVNGVVVKDDVFDNRYELLKKKIDLVPFKDDEFYEKIVKLLSEYVNTLDNRKLGKYSLDNNGQQVSAIDGLDNFDSYRDKLKIDFINENRKLADKLFEYVCNILKDNINIKLDKDTLTKLFNRNPHLFTTLSVEREYLYRNYDYKKLAEIIYKNETLKKSNINIDSVYQMLMDSYQINNEDVFVQLVNKDDFNNRHGIIDGYMEIFNAKTFIEVLNIIVRNYDERYDGISILKRNNNKYIENVIKEMLKWSISDKESDFIHKLLTDKDININYDKSWGDYFGTTDLKSVIALSKNKQLITDLLSNEKNIKNSYYHGSNHISLYNLYAIIGDYKKAIETFNKNYNYLSGYTEDFNDDFNRKGHTYAYWGYEDSIAAFIGNLCDSFEKDNVEYQNIINILKIVLINEKVKYINIDETLPPIKKVLSKEDFKSLIGVLMQRYSNNDLGFITNEEVDDMFYRYKVRVISEEDVKRSISELDEPEEVLKLKLG